MPPRFLPWAAPSRTYALSPLAESSRTTWRTSSPAPTSLRSVATWLTPADAVAARDSQTIANLAREAARSAHSILEEQS